MQRIVLCVRLCAIAVLVCWHAQQARAHIVCFPAAEQHRRENTDPCCAEAVQGKGCSTRPTCEQGDFGWCACPQVGLRSPLAPDRPLLRQRALVNVAPSIPRYELCRNSGICRVISCSALVSADLVFSGSPRSPPY